MVEALTVLVLIASTLLVALPRLGEARRAAALRSLAQQVSGLLVRCRAEAVLHHQNTALVFERSPHWLCFAAVDGDGDGVRRDDLAAGRDRVVSRRLPLQAGETAPGFLDSQPIPEPDGPGWLGGDPDDPVRAGRGNMISFSALGTATPASVYLTDHRTQMRVVRVFGATGRTRCLVWKPGWPEWKQSLW
jgi:hypothetical protein